MSDRVKVRWWAVRSGAVFSGAEGSGACSVGWSRTSETPPRWSAGSVGESGVLEYGMEGGAKVDCSAASLFASAAGTSPFECR